MTKSFIGIILEACVECCHDPLDISQYHGVVVEGNTDNRDTNNLNEEENKNGTNWQIDGKR